MWLARNSIISSGKLLIPTNGLVLHLDAGNTASYPGSGSTWTDLSGLGNHASLAASVTFSSSNGGVLVFNGTSGCRALVSGINFTTGTFTIIGGAKYAALSNGRTFTGNSNAWLMGHYGNSTQNYYAGAWVSSPNAGPNDTNWRTYAATGNTTTNAYSLYVNGVSSASSNVSGFGPNGLSIGGGNAEFANSQVSFCLAYNRVLSAGEIANIHSFFKSRLGL